MIMDSNGTATTVTAIDSSHAASDSASVSPHHPVRLCRLRKWPDFDGYGFNLHAERDKPGQFIGAVDANSPAEAGGLKEGDRIIEVNGEGIEGLGHAGVIGLVKAGGDRTELLVVDLLADAHYREVGVPVSGGMVGVTVISTPATSSSSLASFRVGESEPVTDQAPETSPESVPEPAPQEEEKETLPNGHHEETEEEERKEEEEDVEEAVISTVAMTQAAATVDDVVAEEKQREEEEEEEVNVNDYEQVEVVAPTFSALSVDEDLGPASYGINGGSRAPEPEPPKPEPVPVAKAPEPEPAVIRSAGISNNSSAAAPPALDSGLNLHLSAAEMKERLKARKKQDPRYNKTSSFEAKSKMFEKL